MQSAIRRAEREGFIVFAAGDRELRTRMEMESVEEFEELAVLFVDADDFGSFVGLQIREQHGALFAKLREPAAQRHSMRAGFFIGETFQKKSFDFGRDGVLQAFGFVVGFGPGEADDVGKQHFGELMAEGHALGNGAAFAGEINVAVASDGYEIVAAHAFERGSDGGRSDVQLFSQARADGRLAFFDKFPDGFEVVFLGDAGFCSHLDR